MIRLFLYLVDLLNISVYLSFHALGLASHPGTPTVDLVLKLAPNLMPSPESGANPPPALVSATIPSQDTNSNSVPSYARYRGVSQDMWNRIADIGDPLNCSAKVKTLSASSTQQTLSPCNGNCVNDALTAYDVVELRGGQYKISQTILVGPNKTLKGTSGERVILQASGVHTGMVVNGGYSSNLEIQYAEDIGVKLKANSLVHRMIVGNTGVNSVQNVAGFGFSMHGTDSKNNCLVSVEAYNSFNEDGDGCASCINGGNADGFTAKFGANNVTYIDSHSYQNSDDGFDFWKGGAASDVPNIRIFYSSANSNGKHPTRESGDGNGIKFGSPSEDLGSRLVYGSETCNNLAVGFNRNETTQAVQIFNSTSSGNDPNFYETVNELISVDPHALKCQS